MFSITRGKGFSITFENGVTASVQFGPGNYCDNNYMDLDAPGIAATTRKNWESSDAEVAAWDSLGNWITRNVVAETIHDDVIGYLTPNEVAAFIMACATYDPTRALPAPLYDYDDEE